MSLRCVPQAGVRAERCLPPLPQACVDLLADKLDWTVLAAYPMVGVKRGCLGGLSLGVAGVSGPIGRCEAVLQTSARGQPTSAQLGLPRGWTSASSGQQGESPNVIFSRVSQMTPSFDWPRLMASSQSKRACIGAEAWGFSRSTV